MSIQNRVRGWPSFTKASEGREIIFLNLTLDRCNNLCYSREHMRAIVNISLPMQLNSVVEKEVATGQYASKSEFFRDLLRSWMETKLARELEESRKELRAGKGKVLTSLSDLR